MKYIFIEFNFNEYNLEEIPSVVNHDRVRAMIHEGLSWAMTPQFVSQK